MNAPLLSTPRVLPFFFDVDPGTRFSLYHAPAPQRKARGGILYIHPFADEMNRTRRMAALQAHRFAQMGFAVFQIDLFGCGDSCGDFSAARWDRWKRDLQIAFTWLSERSEGPMHLWGVRMGGLLALDFASGLTGPLDTIILWEPFLNGRTCINQFLRQGLGARGSTELRAELLAHGTLEVGGYDLALPLVQAVDACDAAALALPPCKVHWFASAGASPNRLKARAARLAESWALRGATLELHPIDGLPFWSSDGASECPAMLAATTAAFGEQSR